MLYFSENKDRPTEEVSSKPVGRHEAVMQTGNTSGSAQVIQRQKEMGVAHIAGTLDLEEGGGDQGGSHHGSGGFRGGRGDRGGPRGGRFADRGRRGGCGQLSGQ